ncbi:MAG: hypothetical protein JWO64_1073, partial [Hyphomicrobiales bacterium]|nr:hypothetical protein [Hyphomicrobiales bacterium]
MNSGPKRHHDQTTNMSQLRAEID